MKPSEVTYRFFAVLLMLLILLPQAAFGQDETKEGFSQPQLEQLLAPIALYPDSLLTQVLMASTYPLEVVQASRWAEKNKNLKGDTLTKELEKQNWDPSVKSLVNFPQVLNMMSEKLDWTEQLGDAFIGQQKEVMDNVQKLRAKADAEGNLKTTKEQKVIVEKETQTIIIEPADPQVVYVPAYNPTVVYGVWPYPAYPPYPVYPPGYVAGAAAFSFAAGVAVGAAWGYAWGNCNWHGGTVNYNYNQNININNNIDRDKYKRDGNKGQGDRGNWQHDPGHRKGVSYRDQATAQKFNKGGSAEAAKSREAFRGRAETGRQELARGGAFEGAGRGSEARSASDRGRSSREGMSSRGGRSGGFGGGGFGGGKSGGRRR